MKFELYYVTAKSGTTTVPKGWLLDFDGDLVPYYLSPHIFDSPLRKGFPYLEKSKLTEDGSFKKYLLYRRFLGVDVLPRDRRGLFPVCLFALMTRAIYCSYEVFGEVPKGALPTYAMVIRNDQNKDLRAIVYHGMKQEIVLLADLEPYDKGRINRIFGREAVSRAARLKMQMIIVNLVLERSKHRSYLTYEMIDEAVKKLGRFWPVKNLPFLAKDSRLKT